jgi:hypothetical protein
MNHELSLLTLEQVRDIYQEHMTVDFPPAERKPLAVLERLYAQGRYRPYGLFDGQTLLAYAMLWRDGPEDPVLLDYLAVCRGGRGKGTGSRVLELLRPICPNLFAEVEDPQAAPDEANRLLRERRVAFYRRAGLVTLDYQAEVFGVRYVMMAWPGVEGRTAMQAHRRMYISQFPPEVSRRQIHIPIEEK